jgi:hypothetical protein
MAVMFRYVRYLVFVTAILGITAFPLEAGKIKPERTVIHFGDVYVGHFQDKVLRIDEIDGTAVDILGLAISAQDATAFTPVPPGVFSARVPALGSINVTLRFEPTAARRFGDAEFTPFTASNAIGFPVVLRGNGVFQKRIIHLRIDAADHPPSQPLDFGTLQIGQSTNRTFTVRNTTKSSLSVTLIWVSCDPPFCDRPGPNTLRVRPESS